MDNNNQPTHSQQAVEIVETSLSDSDKVKLSDTLMDMYDWVLNAVVVEQRKESRFKAMLIDDAAKLIRGKANKFFSKMSDEEIKSHVVKYHTMLTMLVERIDQVTGENVKGLFDEAAEATARIEETHE